jgi:hypothetical protein
MSISVTIPQCKKKHEVARNANCERILQWKLPVKQTRTSMLKNQMCAFSLHSDMHFLLHVQIKPQNWLVHHGFAAETHFGTMILFKPRIF